MKRLHFEYERSRDDHPPRRGRFVSVFDLMSFSLTARELASAVSTASTAPASKLDFQTKFREALQKIETLEGQFSICDNQENLCSYAVSSKILLWTRCIFTFAEQKNFLEHQVVQLQMETDTISDYIQLYQQQRAALNRRQQDKEAQMNQLLSDR